MADSILRVRDISVKYGSHLAIEKITFSIEEGDYIAVIGPNGSGKTTLIKTIMGLLSPCDGEIIKGNVSGRALKIGYLPQKSIAGDKLFPATVQEVVKTGLLSVKKHPKFFQNEDKDKVEKILESLNILELKEKRIGNLSGGQQQRVLLARAMVSSPQILILDEPTSALDPKIRDDFYSLIEKLNKEDKVTMILVSHDIASVGKYTDKMLYLDRELVFFGKYDEFCNSPDMTKYFGYKTQHQICWRHGDGKCCSDNH
jgi:zinc transport system ATP-binding protein